MKEVQEQQELVERMDHAVGRSMAAKQMFGVAKRTAKAAQASVVRVVQKVRTKRAARVARESILRDLEGFDRELRKLDIPADGSRSGKTAPKRKRGRVRVEWNRYIPGRPHSWDNASTS